MSEVFIYKYLDNVIITANSVNIPLTKHRNCWYLALIPELAFSVELNNKIIHYKIPSIGKYAIYNNELLPISNSYKKILLVSDVDGTLYKENAECLNALNSFNRFWISNFEFNGSKLVYNTGRSIAFYSEIKDILLIPDTIITVVGGYAYKFNEYKTPCLLEDYDLILNDYIHGDWDPFLIYQLLLEKFPCLAGCFANILSRRVLMIVPDAVINQYYEEISEFLQNKNREERKGKCMMSRIVYTHQWLVGEAFFEIMPIYSTKKLGVLYFQRKFGFSLENTLAAGDSMNDKELLKYCANSVLVGNAEPNIVKWVNKKNRPNVYHSQLSYANAIVEALEKFKEN